jgi:hypothetical protein
MQALLDSIKFGSGETKRIESRNNPDGYEYIEVPIGSHLFPTSLVDFMKNSAGVIAGSFTAALAMRYLASRKNKIPRIVPDDIDLFVCVDDAETLRCMPGDDAGVSDIGPYGISLREAEYPIYGKMIYNRELWDADLDGSVRLQIVTFNSYFGVRVGLEKFWLILAEGMDFTVAASTLEYSHKTSSLVLRILYVEDFLKQRLRLTIGDVATRPSRIAKWRARGFKGYIDSEHINFDERLDMPQARHITDDDFVRGARDVRILVKNNIKTNIVSCRNVTIYIDASQTQKVYITHTSGKIIGVMNCNVEVYACDLVVDVTGYGSITEHDEEIGDEMGEPVDSMFPLAITISEEARPASGSRHMIKKNWSDGSVSFSFPEKSPEGAWLINYPSESGAEAGERFEFYEEHHTEVFSDPVTSCSYEQTDAWYWKSPSYCAKSLFTYLQLAFWAKDFLEFYGYSSFAKNHIIKSFKALDKNNFTCPAPIGLDAILNLMRTSKITFEQYMHYGEKKGYDYAALAIRDLETTYEDICEKIHAYDVSVLEDILKTHGVEFVAGKFVGYFNFNRMRVRKSNIQTKTIAVNGMDLFSEEGMACLNAQAREPVPAGAFNKINDVFRGGRGGTLDYDNGKYPKLEETCVEIVNLFLKKHDVTFVRPRIVEALSFNVFGKIIKPSVALDGVDIFTVEGIRKLNCHTAQPIPMAFFLDVAASFGILGPIPRIEDASVPVAKVLVQKALEPEMPVPPLRDANDRAMTEFILRNYKVRFGYQRRGEFFFGDWISDNLKNQIVQLIQHPYYQARDAPEMSSEHKVRAVIDLLLVEKIECRFIPESICWGPVIDDVFNGFQVKSLSCKFQEIIPDKFYTDFAHSIGVYELIVRNIPSSTAAELEDAYLCKIGEKEYLSTIGMRVSASR